MPNKILDRSHILIIQYLYPEKKKKTFGSAVVGFHCDGSTGRNAAMTTKSAPRNTYRTYVAGSRQRVKQIHVRVCRFMCGLHIHVIQHDVHYYNTQQIAHTHMCTQYVRSGCLVRNFGTCTFSFLTVSTEFPPSLRTGPRVWHLKQTGARGPIYASTFHICT